MSISAARRPRLLYLAFYFPPSRASGVYRARATANHFAAAGWDVTVMRAPDRFFETVTGSSDTALTDTVDPAIDVVQVPMSLFEWETDIARYGRFRGNAPILAKRWNDWQQRHLFPERYQSWARHCVAEGRRRHRRGRFDLIIATGNPFAAFGAAWALSRLTGAPYVVDYRDSWTLDLFAGADAFPPGHPAWKWERRVLRRAAASVFVNDALRGWHAERYPGAADRMLVVPNGWDPDCLDAGDVASGADRPLSYAYVGTLTANQPVGSMIEGHRTMRERGDHADAGLDLYGHLGFFTGSAEQLRSKLGLEFDEPDAPGLHYRGPVSKAAVGEAYAASDVLVFLAGGSKYVTSGKVFEYMATGKPIVSVHEPGCAAEELLRDYPLWFDPGSLEPSDVAAAMAAAGDAARKDDPATAERARAYAASFTRHRALEPFEHWARERIGARR